MKKLVSLLSGFLVAGTLSAQSASLAMTFTAATGSGSLDGAILYGRNGANFNQVSVDSTGALSLAGAASVTITTMPSFVPVSNSAYTATSYTVGVTSLNLTTLAGASVPCMVCLSSDGGAAAGFKVGFNQSATPPAIMSGSGKGHYIAASTTAQCWGPYSAGTHLHMVGVAASSSVIVEVDKVQ